MRRPMRPPGELGEARRDALGDAVHEVRAHRVAAVDEHVHDEHRVLVVAEEAHLDVARAAAALDEARDGAFASARSSSLCVEDARRAPPRGRATLRELDLRDHERRVHLGLEAAALAHHLRRVRRRGDDARLLDDHRHDVVVAVDAHVERDAVRQA